MGGGALWHEFWIGERGDREMHGGDIYRNKVEIDFSVNVNPLGIPDSVKSALADAAKSCQCYPDIMNEELKEAICFMTGADGNSVLCGNGASELFLAIVHGIRPKKEVLKIVIPVPSFYGYEKVAKSVHGDIFYYEMKEETGFCLEEGIIDFLTEEMDVLFLANPNNPVGNCIGQKLLERVMKRCLEKRITVVLDECFIEFVEDGDKWSYLRRTEEFPNLIVVRSFTKIFAIPGVRLGYLVCGSRELYGEIEEQLPEWNISVFAQKSGAAAARESVYRKESVEYVKKERDYLTQGLRNMGISVFLSEANYLMLYTECDLGRELLKQGILIRDCSNYRGLDEGYYRIAVKTRIENERFLDCIKGIRLRMAGDHTEGC